MNKRLRKKKGLSKITKEELWDLDSTIGKFVLPRLIKFKEINQNSYPIEFKSIEEWHKTIDKMIFSFEILLKENVENNKENNQKYFEGIKLFAEYLCDLWD